ncbi:MAG: hypothetical protein EOO53_14240 [Gammaproteobacteria bacterium]|nr:MAG: hypothetical protein EOO53_14240 [Gammaproteobacteria bacterium]
MVNLVTESETIPVKDAIAQVNRNIFYLQSKLQDANHEGSAFHQIQKFYAEKIDVQKTALDWLQKAMRANCRG